MRLIWDNLWDDYTLTESQEDANYPAENTQHVHLTKVWRTTTASAATLALDAGTGLTITCDCAAILAHNFSASAGVCVQAATAPTFASIALSANVTWRDGTMVVYFTSGAYRCWRISIDDTGNSDGYYEVGRVFLGEYLQVDPSSAVEFPEAHQRTDRQTFGLTNQLYADEGIGFKTYRYRFRWAANAMKASIQSMWEGAGMHSPLVFMNYDTQFSVVPPMYCIITDPIEFQHQAFDHWDFELNLRECG